MEKLKRLGHLVFIPLAMVLISACSGPDANKSPAQTLVLAPAKKDPAPAKDPAPDPAPADVTPQQMPAPPTVCMDEPQTIPGMPEGSKLSHPLLIHAAAIKGKKVTFVRGDLRMTVSFGALAKPLHRFIAERKGARRFPEERAVMNQLKLRAHLDHNIVLDLTKPTWFKAPPAFMQRRVYFMLADIVASGGALEVNGKAVELLLVEYSHYCGELCGAGGHAVLTVDGCRLLFRTVDWVS